MENGLLAIETDGSSSQQTPLSRSWNSSCKQSKTLMLSLPLLINNNSTFLNSSPMMMISPITSNYISQLLIKSISTNKIYTLISTN
jgi:hypothetical protein